MKNLIRSLLPPSIGSFLLTGMAFYNEKQKNYSGIEPCEIFTLSYFHYLILLIALTIIGWLVQIGITEQIIRLFKIQNNIQWITLGGFLTILMGLGFLLLERPEDLGPEEFKNSLLIGFSTAAVYVIGNLGTLKILKRKNAPGI